MHEYAYSRFLFGKFYRLFTPSQSSLEGIIMTSCTKGLTGCIVILGILWIGFMLLLGVGWEVMRGLLLIMAIPLCLFYIYENIQVKKTRELHNYIKQTDISNADIDNHETFITIYNQVVFLPRGVGRKRRLYPEEHRVFGVKRFTKGSLTGTVNIDVRGSRLPRKRQVVYNLKENVWYPTEE